MVRLRHILLATSLLGAVGGPALAQAKARFDPAQLPAITGKAIAYSLTPRGDVDGLILADGTEVHFPPFLGTALVYAVKPGDEVKVRGLKALAIPVVQAMSVTNVATGQSVTDGGFATPGPGGPRRHGTWLTTEGSVRMRLYGPRGELNGALLSDGTQVHLPPPEAARLAAWLDPGKTIVAQGYGRAGPLGTVIGAEKIGPSEAQLVTVARPGPQPHRHGGPSGAAPPPPPFGGPPPPPLPQ
jgi:hypothetical protein